MTDKPWANMDPNSAHQLWSRWVIVIYAASASRWPSQMELSLNARKFARALWHTTTGRVSVLQTSNPTKGICYRITCEVEGPTVHDAAYRAWAIKQWQAKFVDVGFGLGTRCEVDAALLAGDAQDGRPPTQVIVMPTVVDEQSLFGRKRHG